MIIGNNDVFELVAINQHLSVGHSKVVFNIFEKFINKIVQLDLISFQPVLDNCLAISLCALCAVISLALRVNVFISVLRTKSKFTTAIYLQKLFRQLCPALV